MVMICSADCSFGSDCSHRMIIRLGQSVCRRQSVQSSVRVMMKVDDRIAMMVNDEHVQIRWLDLIEFY